MIIVREKNNVRHGYPWVPTDQGPRDPCQVEPDLPEVPLTRKWARRPYPQSRRPQKSSDDLIQIAEDLPGLWRKLLPRSRCDAAKRPEDRGILSVITEGGLPKICNQPR
jgi:hypothetical protein